jgi:outer membrane receptor for ferrienterochelin and colicins
LLLIDPKLVGYTLNAKMKSRLGIALFVVLITTALPAAAQTTLRGVVRDESQGALPGATIIVESERSSFSAILETAHDGRFASPRLPDGDYRVTATANGFEALTVTVHLPTSDPLELTLRPAPVVEQVLVVSADRQEQLRQNLNTRVDVISRARIDATGAETVAEVLRELPGVLTRRGSETAGPAGEQIQGIDSRQVLVLLDGQPIPSARGIKRGIVNLDRQSTARLDRIEVVKGAASALYGSDAVGGVVNLITRDANAPLSFHTLVSGGSFGDVNANAEIGMRRAGWSGLFILERHQHDGFDLTPDTFDTTGAPFRRTDALIKLSGRVHPAVTLSALATGYRNNTTGRSNGELGPQEDDIDDDTSSLNIAADWLVRPTVTVQTRGYTSRYNERSTARLAPPAFTPLDPGSLDEDVSKLDASLSMVVGARQHVQGGMEYWDNRYAGDNRIAFDEVTASTAVGWAQHRLTVGDRLTTTVGARVDHHSTFGTAVSPKVAASMRLTDGVNARVSYGGGFRAPDLGQLYYRFLNPSSIYQVIGNPQLQPEYAKSLQLGADWMAGSGRGRFGVNLFHNDVNDLIESVSLGMVVSPAQLAAILAREGLDPTYRPVLGRLLFTYKNVSDALTQGAELDGELAVTRQVTVAGAYTYLQAKDARNDVPLTGRHPHQAHVRISWQPERVAFRANIRATAYSSWIAARTGTVDTVAPGFVLWDAYASQRLLKGLSAFAAIENLTDNQDPNTGLVTATGSPLPIYRPDAGRAVRVGVRWDWTR